jgi:hypothetical protein
METQKAVRMAKAILSKKELQKYHNIGLMDLCLGLLLCSMGNHVCFCVSTTLFLLLWLLCSSIIPGPLYNYHIPIKMLKKMMGWRLPNSGAKRHAIERGTRKNY